jgi:hypothetical protein
MNLNDPLRSELFPCEYMMVPEYLLLSFRERMTAGILCLSSSINVASVLYSQGYSIPP